MQPIGQWRARIFCSFPLSGDPTAQETPQKWLNSSMYQNLLCIWWGVFLHFCSSGVCCTCQSPVKVISLYHQHCNPAQQWPSALILFHHVKIHLRMSMSYWTGDYRRVQFHQHSPCPLAGIRHLFWSILCFSSPYCFRIYNGTVTQHSLVYQFVYFLKKVDPAIWCLQTVDT